MHRQSHSGTLHFTKISQKLQLRQAVAASLVTVYTNTAVLTPLSNVCIYLCLNACTQIKIPGHIYTQATISQYVKTKLFKTSHLEQNHLNILSFPGSLHLKHSLTNSTVLHWWARLHQATLDAGCFSFSLLHVFNFSRGTAEITQDLKRKKISSSSSH